MALIPGLNYVESIIRNEILDVEVPDDTSNATLVIGTARQGKTNVTTKIGFVDAKDKFGDVFVGPDFETNLNHAALAILASTAARDHVLYGYKVGDSVAARLDLYENQVYNSGDRSFSLDSNGDPIVAMEIVARAENERDNQTQVTVKKDASGLPSSVIFQLADGYTKVFAVDPFGNRPGVPSTVQELVSNINDDRNISDQYQVNFNALRRTNHEATAEQATDGSGQPVGNVYIEIGPSPVTPNQSWGDKLLDIEELKEEVVHEEQITSGDISVKLTFPPLKDDDELTKTITSFKKVVTDETLLTVGPSQAGGSSFTKDLALTNPGLAWDQDDNSIDVTKIQRLPGGDAAQAENISASNYSISSGIITVTGQTMAVNDKFIISYEFDANLVEADVKSQLVSGDENSYFVAGRDIIFGAAPSLPIKLTYTAVKNFQPGDIDLVDRENIRIEFINSSNAPEAGSSVYITFQYLPELPAPTASTISGDNDTRIQGGALRGGTSGANVGKQRYYELVEEALDATMLTPFRRVMVAGAYLDDIVNGIDPETGRPGQIVVNWADLLARKLLFKSQVASECSAVMGVRPITPELLDQGTPGINTYIRSLLDDLDVPTSPASLMSALDSYHIDVAVGAPFVADTSILNGAGYIENPAYVVCGMQLDNPLTQSLIRAPVPSFVQRLMVTFPSGNTVGRLNNARFTTLVVNPKGQMRIADAPTAAAPNTQLSRQIVRDTVYATVKVARDIAEGFLGRRRDAQTISLMESRVNRDVQRAMVPDFVGFFKAEIIPVQGGHITGETKMRLLIETSVEIRRVLFDTTVKLGGEDL